ncbi:MAG: hypothetical protein RIS70_349 [Planctomycetota bacterium]
MAAEPRSVLVDQNEPGIYHCYNRCVRQASLCGTDYKTGKSYGHRKQWISDRLAHLARGFAIDVLDFCEMDNHLHLLLRNRPDLVALWDDREVAERWTDLCPSELEKLEKQQARRLAAGQKSTTAVVDVREQYLTTIMNDQPRLAELRTRLSDISWLMKLLCENIARQANCEDEVTGKFWESRFQSDRILDDAHALACSMYINLNPIRAQMEVAPEQCSNTSLGVRMAAVRELLLRTFGPDALKKPAADQADMLDEAGMLDPDRILEIANQQFAEACGDQAGESEVLDCPNAAPFAIVGEGSLAFADADIATAGDQSQPIDPSRRSGQSRLTKVRQPGRSRSDRTSDAWLSRLSLLGCETMVGGSAARAMAMANAFPAPRASNKGFLPISLADYLRVIDWTGRQAVKGKRGKIPDDLAPIEQRLEIDLAIWPELVASFGQKGRTARGSVETLEREAARRGRKWIRGKRAAPRATPLRQHD